MNLCHGCICKMPHAKAICANRPPRGHQPPAVMRSRARHACDVCGRTRLRRNLMGADGRWSCLDIADCDRQPPATHPEPSPGRGASKEKKR